MAFVKDVSLAGFLTPSEDNEIYGKEKSKRIRVKKDRANEL